MTDHRIAIVLLAAGASRRMRGADKLLGDSGGGIPLLRRVADAAWTSTASEIVVVLGARAEARRDALGTHPLRIVVNEAWQSGMASSIRAGVEALPEGVDGALVLLGDMPEISSNLIDRLIAVFDPDHGIDIVRPLAASGPVGNPILFGKRYFAALMALTGDTGAKEIIAANPDRIFDLPTGDDSVLVDLDTPEAWEAWRGADD